MYISHFRLGRLLAWDLLYFFVRDTKLFTVTEELPVVEDLRNLMVRVGQRQFADAVDHRRSGAFGLPGALRTRNLQFRERLGLPADPDVDGAFTLGEGDVLDQETQELLALGVRGRRGLPHRRQILSQGQDTLPLWGTFQAGGGW